MTAFSDEVAALAAIQPPLSAADFAAAINAYVTAQTAAPLAGTAGPTTAASPSPVAATAPAASGPSLAALRLQYMTPGSAWATTAGQGKITDWSVPCPGYLFVNGGALIFPAILSGPQIEMQNLIVQGAQAAVYAQSANFPISEIPADIVAAVTAWKAANPSMVPVGPALAPIAQPTVGPPVTCPKTGNVYPAPQPSQESLPGYFQRVAPPQFAQAVGAWVVDDVEAATATSLGVNAGDPTNWPEIVDAYCYPMAYMTSAQIAAQAASLAAWQAAEANINNPGTSASAKKKATPAPAPAPTPAPAPPATTPVAIPGA